MIYSCIILNKLNPPGTTHHNPRPKLSTPTGHHAITKMTILNLTTANALEKLSQKDASITIIKFGKLTVTDEIIKLLGNFLATSGSLEIIDLKDAKEVTDKHLSAISAAANSDESKLSLKAVLVKDDFKNETPLDLNRPRNSRLKKCNDSYMENLVKLKGFDEAQVSHRNNFSKEIGSGMRDLLTTLNRNVVVAKIISSADKADQKVTDYYKEFVGNIRSSNESDEGLNVATYKAHKKTLNKKTSAPKATDDPFEIITAEDLIDEANQGGFVEVSDQTHKSEEKEGFVVVSPATSPKTLRRNSVERLVTAAQQTPS
jgi:hypothetical protein